MAKRLFTGKLIAICTISLNYNKYRFEDAFDKISVFIPKIHAPISAKSPISFYCLSALQVDANNVTHEN